MLYAIHPETRKSRCEVLISRYFLDDSLNSGLCLGCDRTRMAASPSGSFSALLLAFRWKFQPSLRWSKVNSPDTPPPLREVANAEPQTTHPRKTGKALNSSDLLYRFSEVICAHERFPQLRFRRARRLRGRCCRASWPKELGRFAHHGVGVRIPKSRLNRVFFGTS